MLRRRGVEHRDQDFGQRLAHLDRHFAAQGQHHRRALLRQRHHLFEAGVDQPFVGRRERREMHRFVLVAAAHGVEVREDAVGDERCERRCEHRDGLKTGVQRLIGRQFVFRHAASPEPLAVEAHVPVREVLAHELLNGAGRRSRVVVFE